jgi:hypothetical protein
MKTPMSNTCSATKPDGSKCQAAAIPRSQFCFFHDPSKADRRREAQAQGGRQNRIKTLDPSVPDVNLRDGRDATALISQTINQVRRGEIDPRVANSIGYLANILIKSVERSELETRIEQLEAAIKVRTPATDLTLTGDSYEQ